MTGTFETYVLEFLSDLRQSMGRIEEDVRFIKEKLQAIDMTTDDIGLRTIARRLYMRTIHEQIVAKERSDGQADTRNCFEHRQEPG